MILGWRLSSRSDSADVRIVTRWISPPSGRIKQITETGFPFQEDVLQPTLASLSRCCGSVCAAGAWFARNHASSSSALCDWTSKLDSFLTSDETTSSAWLCHPARCADRVLCQIKEPRIAIEISAAAIDHLTSGERSGRLTFTPARMLSRKSTGTSIEHHSLVIVESNAIDSLNQRSRTGSRRACSSASAKRGSSAS